MSPWAVGLVVMGVGLIAAIVSVVPRDASCGVILLPPMHDEMQGVPIFLVARADMTTTEGE